jgi:predicted permease
VYEQLIPIIAPVAICALLGFGWAKTSWPFERDFLTRLIMNIGVPCLILRGIAGLETAAPAFLTVLAIAIGTYACCALLGSLALRATGQSLRSFLPPVVFGNAGNLGLPLCFFAFGDEGLGLAVAFYLVGSVAQFTVAPLFQGREPAWRVLVRTPVIYAAAAGLGLLATDTALPPWAANTVSLIGGIAIPLMLLALGHALGSFALGRIRVAAGVGLLRLGLGFAVGVGAAELLGLTGVMRGVVILESAMPVAVFNFLLAARYARHPEDVAGAIVLSTILAFLTLPALLLYALQG